MLMDTKIDFAVGGQAVIEGVMMRSPNNLVVAVRNPQNEIVYKKKPFRTLTQRYKWLNIPILRGMINLIEMMVVGTDAINYSASISMDEEEETKNKNEHKKNVKLKENGEKKMGILEIIMFSVSLVLALAFSLFLFKFLPLSITTLLEKVSPLVKNNFIVFNLIDGALKMSIFLLYIFILSKVPSFNRIFQYHGAEHKSIFTYENSLELNPENAEKQSRFHPRCGTSFILIVFVISIIVYTFVPKQETFLQNFIVRIGFLPIIAGISYEYLKLSAKYSKNSLVKLFIKPGLLFQHLTTQEPNKEQLEVGLSSLREALKMEK